MPADLVQTQIAGLKLFSVRRKLVKKHLKKKRLLDIRTNLYLEHC